MLAGQLNLIDPLDFANLRAVPGNTDFSDNNEAAFALIYSEVMSLCSEESPETGSFGNGLDGDIESAFPSTHDASPFHFAIKSGLRNTSMQVMPPGFAERNPPLQSLPTATLEPAAKQIGGPLQSAESPDNLAQQSNSVGALNKSQLSTWMDAHALTRSSHHCAMYCRLGMEAAGLNTGDRPQSGDAGDYGPFLLRHGAQIVPQDSYSPQVGDVVVFDKTTEHPNGHIEMFDGQHWVSDFMQHTFSPYRNVASSPPYTIYRLA